MNRIRQKTKDQRQKTARYAAFSFLVFGLWSSVFSLASAAEALPFNIYTDSGAPDNHYVPSGWMGDWGDIKMNAEYAENPHSGATAIEVVYSAVRSQGANWAGVYWQDPANNWGDKKGGFDLKGAKKLVFWARGKNGGEKIDEVRSGGLPGEHFDSDVGYLGPIVLTTEWTRYEIDLAERDMSSIKGGFMWSARYDDNKNGFTIYLDDIRYE